MRPFPLLAVLLVLAGCGTPGRNVVVRLPEAQAPTADERVRADVGRLLSADARVSAAATERLRRLDEEELAALLRHAERIPNERDPRWLHVLDENHALPPLTTEEELDFLAWKVERADPYDVMKAQSRLLDLAKARPEAVVARLERGGPGSDALAVSMALAGDRRALRPLLERYRAAPTPGERRALAEAITALVGEARRPPSEGSAESIERAAASLEAWAAAQEEEGASP